MQDWEYAARALHVGDECDLVSLDLHAADIIGNLPDLPNASYNLAVLVESLTVLRKQSEAQHA